MTVKSKLRMFRNNVEIPLPPGSWRFIDMSMEPISEAYQAERAIDGTLVDLGYDGWDLYRISISCSDQSSPALAGIWPGAVLTIYGTEDLIEPGPAVTLTREPVPGSIRACAADGRVIAEPEGRTLNVAGAAYFRYRPILSVMVTGFSTSSRELKADVRWSLSAEEVDASVAPPVVPTGPGLPDELVDALGGEVEEFEDQNERKWRVHRFESSASLQILAPGEVECLVVAGGGGGGHGAAAGGGAGGVFRASVRLDIGTFAVIVGAGGPGGSSGSSSNQSPRHGKRGSASSFAGIVCKGGGGGWGFADDWSNQQVDGGSGGGQGWHSYAGISGRAGSGDEFYGHRGGNAGNSGGGGGGGASTVGGSGSGASGGDGLDFEFASAPVSVGGGGSGSGHAIDSGGGLGGYGGGGAISENGILNTGGGGGAQSGNGGSGLILIKYRIA
ncbi:glycine-rich domain-containing protein [Sulfitobacter dubius]|uniref:glycine-rich domain-containing protein n=1 Tax=Sulfitobacter dubius TaxID=218673 RepID=UPI0022AF7069|nr:hypothetical protein [Sulfitobacter dubius]MCZ4366616.1 hypothetical protein [Sulfitobacter dubius]